MKILFINSVLGVGSTGRIVGALYNHFKELGHDVKVAYGRNKNNSIPIEDQFCFYSKANVCAHGLFARVFDNAGLNYSRCATKRLIKFIDSFKPDVVNLHNLHGYYLNVDMLLKYLGKNNIKCVFTLHDCWLFTGHCAYFYYNKCDGYMHNCAHCKFKCEYPKSIIMNSAKHNFKKKKALIDGIKNKSFIVPSKWIKDLAQQSTILKNDKIDVVYNSINLDVFRPQAVDYFDKSKLPCDKYILCVANYWNDKKGLGKVVELSNVLTDNYKIVMVGYLKDRSILNDNIIYIEHTDSVKELAFYYANANAFYNPTLEDVYGLVTDESLACGTPVVLFKGCSGGVEVVKQTNGQVIDENTSAQQVFQVIKDVSKLKNQFTADFADNQNKFYKGYEKAILK